LRDREDAACVLYRKPHRLRIAHHRAESQLDAATGGMPEAAAAMLRHRRRRARRRPSGTAGDAAAARVSNRTAVIVRVERVLFPAFEICRKRRQSYEAMGGLWRR